MALAKKYRGWDGLTRVMLDVEKVDHTAQFAMLVYGDQMEGSATAREWAGWAQYAKERGDYDDDEDLLWSYDYLDEPIPPRILVSSVNPDGVVGHTQFIEVASPFNELLNEFFKSRRADIRKGNGHTR